MTARHDAREAALKILYSCEISGAPANEAISSFFSEHWPDADMAVRAFSSELVLGALTDVPAIDTLIAQHSQHWRLERLAILDRLILRIAVWELQHEPDLPAAVVLNEALELARTYSTDGSVAFVNGVLDGIRNTLRGPRSQASGLSDER